MGFVIVLRTHSRNRRVSSYRLYINWNRNVYPPTTTTTTTACCCHSFLSPSQLSFTRVAFWPVAFHFHSTCANERMRKRASVNFKWRLKPKTVDLLLSWDDCSSSSPSSVFFFAPSSWWREWEALSDLYEIEKKETISMIVRLDMESCCFVKPTFLILRSLHWLVLHSSAWLVSIVFFRSSSFDCVLRASYLNC